MLRTFLKKCHMTIFYQSFLLMLNTCINSCIGVGVQHTGVFTFMQIHNNFLTRIQAIETCTGDEQLYNYYRAVLVQFTRVFSRLYICI